MRKDYNDSTRSLEFLNSTNAASRGLENRSKGRKKKIPFLETFGRLMLVLLRGANLNKTRKLTLDTVFDSSAQIVRAFLTLS